MNISLFSHTTVAAALLLALGPSAQAQNASRTQPSLTTRNAPVIEQGGRRFRDLDRNGKVDPYEDWRLTPAARARDLVGRMTLEEKAGAMMHGTARSGGPMGGAGVGTGYDSAANRRLIADVKVNSMITRLGGAPAMLAAQSNVLQEIAEGTRLGIPVTISTDPRHHFQYVLGASVTAGRFSQWPEALGFAAIGDAALMKQFGDIARREYRAVGIQMALSPQADLATEPRWSRINGTFGEDANVAARMVRAYVQGFQHGTHGPDSAGVMAVVKHWVGYGAAKLGYDSHNAYGRVAEFSGQSLDYHVTPFIGAFAANVAAVMPTYSILEGAALNGEPIEQVGAGYNRQLLMDLLRGRYGFEGVILTDWAITNDCDTLCLSGVPQGQRPTFAHVAMPWGVEQLTKPERFIKAVNAGVDQFGGTEESHILVEAVRAGSLLEARLDESAYRVLVQKFRLGLFENPYVDFRKAARTVGTAAFQREGTRAQARALVVLENKNRLLPVKAKGKRVFLIRIDPKTAARYGFIVVRDPAKADLVIARMDAPFETLHPGYVFGAMQHEGDLGFREGDAELDTIRRVSAKVPTIVTVYLDRPAILTPIAAMAGAVVANFGVSDAALLDVLTGKAKPEGRLPFELPSSMAEVEAQKPDVAHDSRRPLYPIGFGLSY